MHRIDITNKSQHLEEIKNYIYETCKYINKDYINHTFNVFDAGYVYYESSNLIGVLLWEIVPFIYDPSCASIKLLLDTTSFLSEQLGVCLCSEVEDMCFANHYRFIELIPANELQRDYYRGCGYRIQSDGVSMIKFTTPLIVSISCIKA